MAVGSGKREGGGVAVSGSDKHGVMREREKERGGALVK